MTAGSEAVLAGYDAQRAVMGVSVTYSRGATSLTLSAVPGRTDYEAQLTGRKLTAQTRDYLVKASELTIGEPQSGDQITEGSRTLQVFAQPGMAAWDWSDPYRQIYRIHAKEV